MVNWKTMKQKEAELNADLDFLDLGLNLDAPKYLKLENQLNGDSDLLRTGNENADLESILAQLVKQIH